MTDFKALLRIVTETDVEFIVIGGVAAAAHGAARATFDLDVVYRRTAENIDRLVLAPDALPPLPPWRPARSAVPLECRHDPERAQFHVDDRHRDLDLLGEVTGGGSYDMLAASTVLIRAFGTDCRLLNLDRLIEVKRASGRPKDFEVIAELETIRDSERARSSK